MRSQSSSKPLLKRNDAPDAVFFIVAVLLFLASMNLFNKYFYLVFFALAIFIVLGRSTFSVNLWLIVLVLFSCCSLLFNPESLYGITAAIKKFIYPLCYFLGLNILTQRKRSHKNGSIAEEMKRAERLFLSLCVVIAAGIAIHVLLNLLINLEESNRNLIDIWTEQPTSATLHAAMMCLGIGMIPALLLNKSSVRLKVFAAVQLIVFVIFALMLASRTFFVLAALVFVVGIVDVMLHSKSRALLKKILLVLFCIALLLVLIFVANPFGIRTWLEGTNFYQRFFGEYASGLFSDTRLVLKRKYFEKMFSWEYMWGGDALRRAVGGSYAHELYLDTYSADGIIAYVLVIAFVFSSSLRAFRLALGRKGRVSRLSAALILGILVALNVEFFIEPILAGISWLFPTYCLLAGMTDRLSVLARTAENEEARAAGNDHRKEKRRRYI